MLTTSRRLIACSRVLREKLISSQLVKNAPPFMEPEGSLPHSQKPSSCHYPQQIMSFIWNS